MGAAICFVLLFVYVWQIVYDEDVSMKVQSAINSAQYYLA